MMWILLALVSRFLWSGCNAADQVVARAFKTENVKASMVVTSCMAMPFGLLALFLCDEVRWDTQILTWVGGAFLAYMTSLAAYFYCLKREEAYNIVPLMEMTPVFLIIISILLNGETLSKLQFAGAAIIIVCGFLFSWDFKQSRIKTHILWPVVWACFIFAIYQYCVRMASDHADVWNIVGILLLMESMAGFAALVLLPRVRDAIFSEATRKGSKTLYVVFSSNVMSFLALAALTTAFVQAPTTGHVAALSGAQPFFSYLLAFVLAYVWPRHYKKVTFDLEMKVKLLLLIVLFVGIDLLAMN